MVFNKKKKVEAPVEEEAVPAIEDVSMDDEDLEALADEEIKEQTDEEEARKQRTALKATSAQAVPKEEPATEVPKRYAPFAMPERAGIVDSETGEVVGEGEMAMFTILAEILNRMERIENSLGILTEG